MGRAYAKPIENFKAETFKSTKNEFVSTEAEVRSDKYPGYSPMQKEYPDLEMVLSKKGQSMLNLHSHINGI